MRVATWNVNSVKQRIPRLLPWLDERRPDVVCLQETKLSDEAFHDVLGADLAELLEATIETLTVETDPVMRQRHALSFWDHLVDHADSIAFRLMYNTLRATYEPALPALAVMMAAEVFSPSPAPAAMPHDSAMTFLQAPPISAPTTSELV